jgi:hypothetical protein
MITIPAQSYHQQMPAYVFWLLCCVTNFKIYNNVEVVACKFFNKLVKTKNLETGEFGLGFLRGLPPPSLALRSPTFLEEWFQM